LQALDTDDRLELFFSQSLDGFFFMMLDEPVRWDDSVDKERVLDYVFEHQRMTKVNDALLAQYGTTRDAFLGVTPQDLFRHDIEHGRRVWRDFFDRGRLHVETDERRVDGTPIRIEGDYLCFYDTEKRITGHFGIQRDVTERQQLQERVERHAAELEERVADRTAELTRSENRLAAIVSALPDLVFVVDDEGRYLEILTSREDLLYRAPAEMKGKRFHDILPGPTADTHLQLVRRTLETGASQVLEYSLEVQAGERWFEGRTGLLGVEIENHPAVAFIVRDITDKKRAEELESQNIYLREELKVEQRFGEIVGHARAMQEVFNNIGMVAATDSTVLILGETGTGKELIARAIHDLSRRKRAVMIKVNCGALPSALAESELFGHERGAFTGAVQQKKGRFELAHNGTIFLDEVGELSADVQVKLLRVLQEQELERLGSTHTTKVNVRVIAATNRDLHEDVRRGTFRADLFYRLNIFPIHVPPLRERKEDVPLLAEHFVSECARRMGKPVRGIGAQAAARLTAYEWPGNIRELANVIERAVILCQGTLILEDHIGALTQASTRAASFFTLEEMERQHILSALQRTGGVLAGPQGAARLLGMSRSTVWSRMRKLGIQAPRA
jgi:formate hydrogenlyase transcriptional activator